MQKELSTPCKEKGRKKLDNQHSSNGDHDKKESCVLLKSERPNSNCECKVETSHIQYKNQEKRKIQHHSNTRSKASSKDKAFSLTRQKKNKSLAEDVRDLYNIRYHSKAKV